jgi:YidC/Oxa1 family membrane protein insertase
VNNLIDGSRPAPRRPGTAGPNRTTPINLIMVLANIFQPLIDIFGPVLVFFHSIIGGSWGWSIIALTIVVRALLLPLALKQMHSMQKLQQVAPQMKTIQAKYKDDKQRQH